MVWVRGVTTMTHSSTYVHCKNGIVKVTTKVVMFTTNPSHYHVVNSYVVKITTTDDVITEYF